MAVEMSLLLKQIKLEKDVSLQNRYFLQPDSEEYLKNIVDFGSRFIETLSPANSLFRARLHDPMNRDSHVPHLGYEYSPEMHSRDEMGAPPSHKATGGRLNPPGLPFLYCASDKDTAIAEMRPWKGAYLTVANVAVIKELKVVDLRCRDPEPIESKNENSLEEKWWVFMQYTVCRNFAIPYHPSDNLAYIPTQLMACAFKARGYDGILYTSAMNLRGYNIALFDPKVASIESVERVTIDDVTYITRQ